MALPKYEINGIVKTRSEWCDFYGIRKDTVTDRMWCGWDIVTALTTPIKTSMQRPKRRTN